MNSTSLNRLFPILLIPKLGQSLILPFSPSFSSQRRIHRRSPSLKSSLAVSSSSSAPFPPSAFSLSRNSSAPAPAAVAVPSGRRLFSLSRSLFSPLPRHGRPSPSTLPRFSLSFCHSQNGKLETTASLLISSFCLHTALSPFLSSQLLRRLGLGAVQPQIRKQEWCTLLLPLDFSFAGRLHDPAGELSPSHRSLSCSVVPSQQPESLPSSRRSPSVGLTRGAAARR